MVPSATRGVPFMILVTRGALDMMLVTRVGVTLLEEGMIVVTQVGEGIATLEGMTVVTHLGMGAEGVMIIRCLTVMTVMGALMGVMEIWTALVFQLLFC